MIYKKYGKRIFDLCFSIIALLLLFPIIFTVSFLIKLFDRGPVIFKQSRVGENGRVFLFYKFRSMPTGTGDITSSDLKNVEISKIGRIIRRTN